MPHNDVMIVCSILPMGKPLHMCIGTAMVCLQICQHPHWNPLLLQKLQTSSSLFNPFSMPVTHIYICPIRSNLLHTYYKEYCSIGCSSINNVTKILYTDDDDYNIVNNNDDTTAYTELAMSVIYLQCITEHISLAHFKYRSHSQHATWTPFCIYIYTKTKPSAISISPVIDKYVPERNNPTKLNIYAKYFKSICGGCMYIHVVHVKHVQKKSCTKWYRHTDNRC